jgi:hypothetical protein
MAQFGEASQLARWVRLDDTLGVILARVGAALIVTCVAGFASPPVAAEANLAGRWTSDSLRDNGIGYFAVLRAVGPDAYSGYLRFAFRDGRLEPKIPVAVRVTGNVVTIAAREGRFDREGRILRGILTRSGSLSLTNCAARLRQVMSWDLESDCTLRLRDAGARGASG